MSKVTTPCTLPNIQVQIQELHFPDVETFKKWKEHTKIMSSSVHPNSIVTNCTGTTTATNPDVTTVKQREKDN